MEIPEELKYLAPYIQRGQELNSREPVIAYYAHYYAVKLAISRGPSNQTTNAYLSHLLDALEQQKQALGADNEAIKDDLVGYAHVENFALKVFLSADNEDRSGQASKKTAKTFLAASVFLELLKTFGDLDAEVEAKIKYAKWKAADIIKALREGRVPTPGAPGEQQQQQEDNEGDDDTMMTQPTMNMTQPTMNTTGDADTDEPSTQAQPQLPSAISDFPSPPSNFTAPLAGQSNNQSGQISPPSGKVSSSSSTHSTSPAHSFSVPHTASPPPPPQQQQPQQPQQQQSLPSHEPITPSIPQPTTHDIPTVGPVQIAAAQKNAKWAISALNYDDIKTARTQLLDALNDLGYNRQNNFGF